MGRNRDESKKAFKKDKQLICEICGKVYSSAGSFYNHKRTKHPFSSVVPNNVKQKGKDKNENNNNPNSIEYFENSNKQGYVQDLEFTLKKSLNDLKKLAIDSFFQFIDNSDYNSHAVICKILEFQEESNENLVNPNCDEMFALYLFKVSKICNDCFYQKVVKFALIFRDFLNNENPRSNSSYGEMTYCETFNPEDIPTYINRFLDVFFEIKQNWILNTDVIDLCRNLCGFIYERKFTEFQIFLRN